MEAHNVHPRKPSSGDISPDVLLPPYNAISTLLDEDRDRQLHSPILKHDLDANEQASASNEQELYTLPAVEDLPNHVLYPVGANDEPD